MYKTKSDLESQMIYRIDDKAWIPKDESNSDYQMYLAWVAEGNTAEEWSN